MFDDFLTTLLQIFIVIDLIGAVASFALGAMRRKQRASEPTTNQVAQPLTLVLDDKPLWKKLIPSRLLQKLNPGNRLAFARSQDIDKLRRVLYSFQDGLT
jgi:hypothetical protein